MAGGKRLFRRRSAPQSVTIANFGTNALIAELAERGDLGLAVNAYKRLYGAPDNDLAEIAESERAWSYERAVMKEHDVDA